jgi:chromosome segregation ATPase
MEQQLKEAAGVLEKRTEENYTLKQKIDGQRVEVEKMRKRAEILEDQMVQREGELKMAKEDLEKLQKRTKGLYA